MANSSIMNAQAFRDLYVDLMEEIKARISVIDATLVGFVPPQPPIIVSEFCYLQLRFICELIALGCLAAHGDIQDVHKTTIRKAWNPKDIMEALEKLHPKFYPFPTKQILGENGKVERTEDITEGFLTKHDLKKLYGECGNALHRGNLHNIISKRNKAPDLDRIQMWNKKIITLLNHHQIQLSDPNYQFWVLMQAKEDGRVHGRLFGRADGI